MKSLIVRFFLRFFIYFDQVRQKNIYLSYFKLYSIDKNFKFNGGSVVFHGKGKIVCGANSYIGIGSSLSCNEGYEIAIGNNCAISHNVRIYTNSYLPDHDFNIFPRSVKYGSVQIGDGVWIGANVVILPGVKIGHNSVIGANSVVVNDIPPFAVASGIPCKVIRYKRIDGNSETGC